MDNNKKINIGMTFHGGISLEVYQAGMAEEFIRFLQFCKSRQGKGGMPDIDIQVVSGTSAGGLLAILMSATLVNARNPSLHIQEMRRIWFDIADLSMLLYKGDQDACSFLNNTIFETEIKKFLQMKKDDKGLCTDVTTLITCTNMHGFFDAVIIEHNSANGIGYEEAIPTIRHSEVFEFAANEIRNSTENNKLLERIIKTARITSSFPAAFPPQFFQSPSFPDETYKRIIQGEYPLHFWYLDGSMLDNKPLGHAVDYIESSNLKGEWWYFFVEPHPGSNKHLHEEWGLHPENPPDPFATLVTVLEVSEIEKIYYDLRRIQRMNHQAMQVNELISEILNLFRDKYLDTPKKSNPILKKMEESLKTTHVRSFLPDYLKCVAMLHYRFLRKGGLEDEREMYKKERDIRSKHKAILKNIRPLNPRRIITEYRSQMKNKKKSGDVPKGTNKRRDDKAVFKNNTVLVKYDKALEDVKNAQLLFRQISFWIEDDYKTNRKTLSEETWREFEYAWKRLNEALKSLHEMYKSAESAIQKELFGNKKNLMARVASSVLLDEAIRTAVGMQIREQIKIVSIYHNEDHGSLAGTKIMDFAGLLEYRWRKNDYLIGKMDARGMLKEKMNSGIFASDFWEDYNKWCDERENEIDKKYRLSKNDIIKDPQEREIDNLPSGRLIPQINKILKTFGGLIGKYRTKPFFHQLRIVQANLILLVLRFILWLIRQTTYQSFRRNGERGISTMADFKVSGKRYMGFVFIGIILGIFISFYLPDILREGVRYIYYGAVQFIKYLRQ
jgi:predicted acylesterase/phospholipase RssA